MAARHIGLLVGACALLASAVLPAPAGMSREAFIVAGLVICMAAWWMTEALPLTATALMPFIVLPFAGVMDAKATASAYYSDTVSYTHLRAHETPEHLVCRLLLEKKKFAYHLKQLGHSY